MNYQCTFTPNGEEFNIQANSSNEAFIKCAKEAGSIEWTMVSIKEVSTFWQGDTQEYFKSQLEKFGDGEKAVDFNARSDGSVGWYENLGESVFSDRGILLAQLHELRTIKRCVVYTIVIVIPLIVGAIISWVGKRGQCVRTPETIRRRCPLRLMARMTTPTAETVD